MGIVRDLKSGVVPLEIATRFHSTVAGAIVKVCVRIRGLCGISTAALSGGVFQNLRLLEETAAGLENAGFRVLTHSRVPTNDGGLSLGQAAIEAKTIEKR